MGDPFVYVYFESVYSASILKYRNIFILRCASFIYVIFEILVGNTWL